MANIKAGYLLKITTWENDGDNYNTVSSDGLTDDKVRFIIHVCKKFGTDSQDSFGNEEIHGEAFYEAMKEHIATFKGTVPAKWINEAEADEDFDPEDDYHYQDLLGDIGISSTEYGFWRVFEDAEVFLVPEEIKDVSKDFQ